MADIYIGRKIGNYRIEQTIASGSFGTVYLARHLHLKQRTVAIKILHAVHLSSEEEKEQFLQEAQILETLKDLPNILPLLDIEIDGNIPYMIAKYAEGGSLRMQMRQRDNPLLLQEVLKIIEQVGRGLQGAHDKDIVHRDLKPENILFDAKGEALLADFGISTVLSTASVKYTHVAGTPSYMAPEQFRGEVCKESDQYALACIAYELLTGRKLFQASDFVSMGFLHITEAPTSPRQHNPDIPVSVEYALLKALSKQRTERYPSVSAFVTALNNIDNDNDDDADALPPAQGRSISPTLPSIPPTSSNPNLPPSTITGALTQPLNPSAPDRKTTSPTHNPVLGRSHPPTPAHTGEPRPVWSPTPLHIRRTPITVALVILTLFLLVLGGWAVSANSNVIGNISITPTATLVPTPSPTSTIGTTGKTLHTASAMARGKSVTLLTTAEGRALYYFVYDTATTSVCTKALCTTAWPPYLSDSIPTSTTPLSGTLGVQTNANGSQVTYNGHPLYTYAKDTAAGQTYGDGVGGKWFVATTDLAWLPGSNSTPTSSSGGYNY
jgi:serine/threonine protein kinase